MTDAEWEEHLIKMERLEGWITRFRKKIRRWWLATPFQNGLKSCLKVFSLLIASRLKQAYTGFQTLPGVTTVAESLPSEKVGAIKEGCEWVAQSADELQLPKFPPYDSISTLQLHRQLPSLLFVLPRIPAMLQSMVTNASSRLAKQPWQAEQLSPTKLVYGPWVGLSSTVVFSGMAVVTTGTTILACICGCRVGQKKRNFI